MKKTGLLLLLVPTLFLASCQTTPKIDTIDEKEAQEFINTKYKDKTFPNAPSNASTIKWDITKDDDAGNVKGLVSNYIYTDGTLIEENKKEGVPITDNRLIAYKNELTSATFSDPNKDAVIGMNPVIYKKLYEEGHNDIDLYKFVYKYGPNNGLIIRIESNLFETLYTRTHTYDGDGKETKFEIAANKDAHAFTMCIDFKY